MIEKGDLVRIVCDDRGREGTWGAVWIEEMEHCLGKVGEVVKVRNKAVLLKLFDEKIVKKFYFPLFALDHFEFNLVERRDEDD